MYFSHIYEISFSFVLQCLIPLINNWAFPGLLKLLFCELFEFCYLLRIAIGYYRLLWAKNLSSLLAKSILCHYYRIIACLQILISVYLLFFVQTQCKQWKESKSNFMYSFRSQSNTPEWQVKLNNEYKLTFDLNFCK